MPIDEIKNKIQKQKKMLVILFPGDLKASRLLLFFRSFGKIGFDLDIHIISPKPLMEKYHTEHPVKYHQLSTLFSVRILGYLLYLLYSVFVLLFFLKNELKENNYVFISHEHNLPFLFLSKVIFHKYTVYDQREMFLYGFSNKRPRFSFLENVIEKILLRKIDCVLTIDSHNELWADRYRKITSNVHVIYNVPSVLGIDQDTIRKNIVERNLKGNVDIVMVGGIGKYEGVESIIHAVELIPKIFFQIHLIGYIDEIFINNLLGTYKKGKTNYNLNVLNWMNYNDLVKYISRFHVGIMTKKPDIGQYSLIGRGQSRKPFTYMHAGLPVIAPNHNSVALQIEEEKCGLRVDIKNPYAIAQAIKEIIDNHKQYVQMAFNGLEAIEQKYNWEIESKKLQTIFDE